jgi:hypothetical protein
MGSGDIGTAARWRLEWQTYSARTPPTFAVGGYVEFTGVGFKVFHYWVAQREWSIVFVAGIFGRQASAAPVRLSSKAFP